MAEKDSSPVKIVLNIWAIIGIIVSISSAVVVGFLWLSEQFERSTKLEKELANDKRELKGDIKRLEGELTKVEAALRLDRCRLHYTVQSQQVEEQLLQAHNQVEARAQQVPADEDTRQSAKLERKVARERLLLTAQKACLFRKRNECLERLLGACNDESEPNPVACQIDFNEPECSMIQMCRDQLSGKWRDGECVVDS